MNRISILIVFFAKNWKFIFWSFISSFLLAFAISVLGVNKLGGFLTSSRDFKYKIPIEEEVGSSSLGQASPSKGAYKQILKRNLFKAVTITSLFLASTNKPVLPSITASLHPG